MKFKWKTLIPAVIMTVSVAAVAGCGQTNPPGDGKTNGETADYGTLTIADEKVYITADKACTFAEINPVFSKPDKAEELKYTYDTSEIKIENGIVTPLRRADIEVNVRAKSEHFNVVFKVEVEFLKFEGNLYDLGNFPVAVRADKCKAVTADTTLFIGDSFMDDGFIGEYMHTYSPQVSQTNSSLAAWCAEYDWITCVDTCSKVSASMLKDDDGVHPKTESYKVFTDALVEADCRIVSKP